MSGIFVLGCCAEIDVYFDEAWRPSRAGIAGACAETRCGIDAASARGGDRVGGDV
jgi:hypothetical protein